MILRLIPHPLSPVLSWVPFVTPLPAWDYWWLLLVPLLAGIAVAYKATKVSRRGRLGVEAVKLFAYLLLLILVGGAGLALLVEWVA